MASNSDPSSHQSAERRMIEHVTRLLDDPRLVVDTTTGRRAVTALIRDVTRSDRGVELKRLMSELNIPDRALQDRMPSGEAIDVALAARRLFVFKKPIGHLRVINVSPARALLKGEPVKPMETKELEQFLRSLPLPVNSSRVPVTMVLVSTSGFTIESRALAERTADRTLILVEPNDSGGWSVHGPQETKSLVDLFDPEAEEEKRRRIRAEIDAHKIDLLTGGISGEKIAMKTQLPLPAVEAEVKSYAKENPGLVAKRLDGHMVLFREGATPGIGSLAGGLGSTKSASSATSAAGGSGMPLIDRIRSLFARKGETEKKIAFLAERRAALSQQRERAYEEITALEGKDDELREQFKQARAPLTKRRITSQLVQLRKDIERRQQMIGVLNQQVNVVSTHLHNLELSQQGQVANLPDSEEIAADAAAAEEMLAQLQADNELADSVAGTSASAATAGMTEEEQALFEELERETAGESATATKAEPPGAEDQKPAQPSAARSTEPPSRAPGAASPTKRAEPEAG